jgi:hypothetical protein
VTTWPDLTELGKKRQIRRKIRQFPVGFRIGTVRNLKVDDRYDEEQSGLKGIINHTMIIDNLNELSCIKRSC